VASARQLSESHFQSRCARRRSNDAIPRTWVSRWRIERSGAQRDAAELLQAVADPVAAQLEAALALRRSGADPKALRRALRRIEELLDE